MIKKNNDKIYATNIEILHKFFKDPRICICDNSGLSSRRNPIGRFMSRNDNTHLLYDDFFDMVVVGIGFLDILELSFSGLKRIFYYHHITGVCCHFYISNTLIS
jgi:hypothetical protein